MNTTMLELKELLGKKIRRRFFGIINRKLARFESKNGLLIPSDLSDFFKLVKNPNFDLDKDVYEFYLFDNFSPVTKALGNWGGVPDYRNIVNTLDRCEHCFVFADYMMHLCTYAIRLYPYKTATNEIYLICGDKYKVIADSFSTFIELYLKDAEELKMI